MKFTSDKLIEFDRRPVVGECIAGFVVATSSEIIVVHRLDWNTFSLDGYCAIRKRDTQRCRWLNRLRSWQATALQIKKIKPVPLPFISAESLSKLLTSISDAFPLITIHVEVRNDSVCYLGKVKRTSQSGIQLFNLDTKAKWNGTRRFSWVDITRIDFGDGYANALALTAMKHRP